jgi:hypothetical protein
MRNKEVKMISSAAVMCRVGKLDKWK